MGPSGHQPGLVYEFSYSAELKLPVACAPGHNGTRFFVEATEGRVKGERLSGSLSGGGDWLLAGSDGWGRIDVRTHFTTDDRAFIGQGRFAGGNVVEYDVFRVA